MSDNFAARHKWTDEYLSSNYGNLRVKIEAKAEKEYYPEGDKGVGQDTLQHFLDTYQSRNAYVVSQLPDPMSTEVSVPPFMTCGTFSQRLLEANLWFSSGGTKSLLHRDADNAINCLLFGTKDWIFIHPDHEDKIPIAKEAAEGYGGFALLNPDSVDLLTFPKFADIPWTHGNVTAGDCIFLPQGYWHQVRSYGSRNMAVSLLFSRLREVDLSDCEGTSLSYKPLSEMEMVFTYDGYGEQTMGDTDPFELK
ncbi:bifunctional peptidase and arginyl-hydroxylase JMJD5-like [Diadema antillarum]|uniref:bifunctional peptidase and arginyl-hydroxylase JMJD5-like n=1 Tax=Diadema antillarum TaxID=105358 RepID=UPI003A88AB57